MKVVILAGGFGTRISEETEFIPKPMIEIGGMPIIWHIMKEYSHYGFNEFIICAGYKQQVIKEFFSDYYLYNSDVTFNMEKNEMIVNNSHAEPWKVTVVDTGLNTFTGGRIKRIKDYIGNETFMMTYGDGVCDVDINKLVEYHKSQGKIATLTAIQPGGKFGALAINEENQIENFAEKRKEDGGWVNGGYMVLEPTVFDYLSGDDEFFEQKPLMTLASQGNLVAYKYDGFWQCMDTLKDKKYLEDLITKKEAPWMVWDNDLNNKVKEEKIESNKIIVNKYEKSNFSISNELLDFYKDKRVFITGHTGFKGSWLCKLLLASGANILGYSLEPNTNPNLFKMLELDKQMNSVIGDIRDYDFLYDTMNKFCPDIVIHLAAQPIVRESYKNPKYTYETNVLGTLNVLECVRNSNSVKSCLIVTTDKVYLNKEWDYGYRETDELCGFDPYSNSKSCAELVYYSYYNSYFKENPKISVSTARSGNVIGGGDFASDRIMTDSVNSYLRDEDIVVRNKYSVRPFQHVLDTLNGYLLLTKLQYKDKSLEGSYNFGPNEESIVTTGELVTKFCDELDNKISWVDKSEKDAPHEATFLKLDTTKSKKYLNWEPRWDIDEAVRKVCDWAKAYKKEKNIEKEIEKEIKEFYER